MMTLLQMVFIRSLAERSHARGSLAQSLLKLSQGEADVGGSDAHVHAVKVVSVRRGACHLGHDQRRDQSTQAVHGVEDGEPAIGVVDSAHERVRLRVLQRNGHSSDEIRHHKQRERWLPELQRVCQHLQRRADQHHAASAEGHGQVHVRERGGGPRSKVEDKPARRRGGRCRTPAAGTAGARPLPRH